MELFEYAKVGQPDTYLEIQSMKNLDTLYDFVTQD